MSTVMLLTARVRRGLSLLLCLTGLVAAGQVAAQTQTVSVYVDRDGSAASGCTVSVAGRTMPGVETRIDVAVEIGPTPTITSITRSQCAGDGFGASSAVEVAAAIGLGNGTGGSDVLELGMAEALMIDPAASRTRLGFATVGAAGADALFSRDGGGDGGIDLFGAVPTIIPIPGPGVFALLGTALVVLVIGLLVLRRARRGLALSLFAISGIALAAAIVVDGQVEDWIGVPPLATSPAGSGGADLRAAFLARSGGMAYVRIDLSGLRLAAPVFTSASSASFRVGTSGSFSVTASGLPAPTLALSAGSLPSGVAFNAASGLLSGTPAPGTGGTHPLEFTASNTQGSATLAFVLTVEQAPTITSAASTTFQLGQAGSFTVTADGYPAATFQLAGTLPGGLVFDTASGLLSGTPEVGTAGNYPLQFTASNVAGSSAPQAFTLTIIDGPVFTSAATTTFTVGSAGSFLVTATGTPAPTLALSGTLPGGVSFNAASGELSGTPIAGSGGTHPLQFTASNSQGSTQQTFTLVINEAPLITSASSVQFTVGNASSFFVTASGFPAPSFVLGGDALPAGLSFDSTSGELHGTPENGSKGVYALSFTATNAAGSSAVQAFTLTIGDGPVFTSAAATTFTVGSAGSFLVTATGTPTPTLALSGTLPGGISFNVASGELSGTPDAGTGGTWPLVFTASNSEGDTQQNFSLTILEAPAITSADATSFAVGSPGSFTVTASGFPAPGFALSGTLPSGIAFNTSTGLLSGTAAPGAGGSYALSFTASNAAGTSAAQAFTLTISDGPVFTSAATTTFTVGSAGSFFVTATGTPTPTLALIGTLPGGISFNAASGELSGTPDAGTGGTWPLQFTASNSQGDTQQTFTLVINEAPVITSADSVQFTVGNASSFFVTASGFPAPSFAVGGTLPAGITLNATTGELHGTPADGSNGSYALSFTATNAAGSSAAQNFSLTVAAGPIFTSPATTTFTVGSLGSFFVTATGTPTPTLALTGTLPGGISFNAASGELSGTPDAGTGGTWPLLFTASNSEGDTDQNFILTVNESPAITSGDATTFTVGSAGSFTVTATGFPAPTFALVGTLPTGISFDTASGLLSGAAAPGTGGSYSLSITANNAAGPSPAQAFTLTINEAPAFTSLAATTFTVGSAGSFPLTAAGTPTPSLSHTGGTLPAGVGFDPGSGLLSGTPGAGTGGVYVLEFSATNSVAVNTQSFTLTVNQAPAITSAASVEFGIGSLQSHLVTSSGHPAPALAISGDPLPGDLAFIDNGNGTGTLSGTPTASDAGTYALQFTANNSVGTPAVQDFTLAIQQAPSITSANSTSFVRGQAGNFTVTAVGVPGGSSISFSHSGTLPTGVSFTDNGNGTASIAGTPTQSGSFPLTLGADNGVAPAASQSFTLSVNEAPAITSANTTSFTVGVPGSFAVTSTGFPLPGLSSTGTLPGGINFVDNGNGTATLSGTPANGSQAGSPYNLVFTATNGIGSDATQNFALVVECPVITLSPGGSNLSGSFGAAFSQVFSASGGSAPYTITRTAGTLPPGLTLDGGTGLLSGSPSDAGVYAFTLQATDNVGCESATQDYTLTVSISASADSYTALGNVLVDSSTGTPFSVVGNDSFPAGTTISAFDANTAPGGGTVTMTPSGAGLGRFTYNPPRGKASGTETFSYTLSRQGAGASAAVTATATVTFTHNGRVWFINNNVGACSASCDGRATNPYTNVADFQAANNGTGSNPADNDVIFVHAGGGAYTGALTLRAGQRLIGQGATSTLASLGGITAQAGQNLPAMSGTRPVLTAAAATVVTLGNSNRLHGIELGNGTIALSGTSFGTLTVNENVVINTTGQALALSTGTAAATFAGVSASGTLGASISGVAGTLNVSGGTIAAGAGTRLAISGGSVAGTWAGAINQSGNNFPLLSIGSGHSGALSFSGNLTATSGNGLQFDNADGSYGFTGTLTLNGGDAGIDVQNGSAGSFTFPASATITNPSGEVIRIVGSTPTFTYAGAFSKSSAGVGILVQNNTGGTITFSGNGLTKSLSTGASNAVNLLSNTGTTINFTNGGLVLTTTTGNGFNATGGATAISVQGANNTISATGGTALNVQNTVIGASGLTFQSISANGGSNGIVLNNTGSSGGLAVTGNGGTCTPATPTCTGGRIQNTTGADGSSAGNGIYLVNASAVSLTSVRLNDHQGNALYGTGVRGFTMNQSLIDGLNGTSNSGLYDESAIQLRDVGGSMTVTNSAISGGAYNNVFIDNTAGTSPALTLNFSDNVLGVMQGSTMDVRNSALLVVQADGTLNAQINRNSINFWWGNAIHVLVHTTASGTAVIDSNAAHQTSGALAGAGGIWVAGCSMTFDIRNNAISRTNGTAISADKANCDGVTFQGRIRNNTIGISGVANSGSETGIGIFTSGRNGTTTIRISDNVLRQINGSASGAITTVVGDNVAFAPSGTMNATIVGNNIQESGTTVNNAQHGILITHGVTSSGANDSHLGCYDIGGAGALANSITNFTSGTANNRIRVNQRFATTSRWPGYTGAATGVASTTDMETYLLARNNASTSTNANSSTGGFLNTVPAGSTCPQPASLP